jgi:hypothetical protein
MPPPLQPKATPSLPISIAIRRKAAWRPRPSRDLMRQALKENCPPDVFVDEAEAQARRKLT